MQRVKARNASIARGPHGFTDRLAGDAALDSPPGVELSDPGGVSAADNHDASVHGELDGRHIAADVEPVGCRDLKRFPIGAHLDAIAKAELIHSLEGLGGAGADVRDAPAQVTKIVGLRDKLEHIENVLSLRCHSGELQPSLPSSAALNPGAARTPSFTLKTRISPRPTNFSLSSPNKGGR